MPLNKYFKGHGEEVMANMKKEYGAKKGESVFYATSNRDKGKRKGFGFGKSTGADRRKS